MFSYGTKTAVNAARGPWTSVAGNIPGGSGRGADRRRQGAGALADTFPKLLIRNAVMFAGRPAMRHKDLGIWRTWTWAQMLEEVRAFSVGLMELGLKRGDKIAVIGNNRPRLYWAMCAAQALGAVPVPIYADSVADEMAYVLEHAEVTLAVVEDQEQVDKVLSIADRLPRLQHDGLRRAARPARLRPRRMKSIDEVQKLGREKLAADPARAGALGGRGRRGQGRRPRHHPLHLRHHRPPEGRDADLRQRRSSRRDNGNRFDNLDENEEVIAYLPLAWVGDHIFSYAQSYRRGLLRQLPGGGGNRDRGPPRDRHHLRVRAAAHLREPADADDGADGGRRRAQAPDVRFLHRATRDAGARRSSTSEPVPLHARGCSTGSAKCWSTAR